MSDKKNLRSHYRAKRAEYVTALSPAMMQLSFSTVPSPLRAILDNASCMAAYIPINAEASPLKIVSIARQMGLTICLPHIRNKISPMQFFIWGEGEPLEKGPMGLKQPSANNPVCKPDVILAPLVAFDRSLTRLGQGAGHYDRALSLLETSIVIGLAWSLQEADKLPSDSWDQKMDAIITEKEWII